MTAIIITIAIGWIIFTGVLVTVICMNSSRLSRIDEPFKSPAKLAWERRQRMLTESKPPNAPFQTEV
jgi:hypothetical protein